LESTRIYKILSSLSVPELNRFQKFINSPYHNVNARITGLAVFLIDKIKAKDHLNIDKEEIWSIIEKKVPFSDLKYRKVCNDLLEKFEKFLILEELDSNNILKSNLLLNKIEDEMYNNLIEKHISKSSREIERELIRSSDFYLQKYFYEKAILNLKANFEKKVDLKKGKRESYDKLISNLDAFYLIEKLRLSTDIENWKKMFKSDENIDLGIPMEIIKDFDFNNFPAVEIYKLMFDLQKIDSQKELYTELKTRAFKSIDLFTEKEQRSIIDVLLNYCIKSINKGKLEFYNETLIIYDWGIDNELILENGKLSHSSFRNYIVSGLRIGEFDLVENFITNNAKLLDDDKKENAMNFNLARVSFYRKDFEKVLSYLNMVTYEDLWYNVNSKMLLLATYYELDEENALESSLDAFITYCRRDKKMDSQKKALYYNFAKSLKKFTSIYSKNKLIKFKSEVDLITIMANKKWLLDKIELKMQNLKS